MTYLTGAQPHKAAHMRLAVPLPLLLLLRIGIGR